MKNASPAARIRTSVLLALALLVSYVPLPKAYSIAERSSPASQAKSPIAPGAKQGASTLAAARQKARESYGKMPVYFEANRGQFDPEVKFVSRGSGPKTFLTATEAVFVLHKPEVVQPQLKASGKSVSGATKAAAKTPAEAIAEYQLQQAERAAERTASKSVVRMSLAGANTSANMTGLEELPGKINYFRGSNEAKWVKDVPIFNRVRYAEAYPGIDLIYYGKGSELEYDFVVAPGADPRTIGFSFEGAERVEVDGTSGELIVHAAGGAQLRQSKPLIYQEAGGAKHAVTGGFTVSGSEVKFAVGNYDAARPLIIDPVLFSYSTYLGGERSDRAHDIAVDAEGNAYIAGWTDSDSFPTKNAYQPGNNNSLQEAFITKLDPSGSALVWSTYLGGGPSLILDHSEGAYGITIDADRNVYVTGFTNSGDFPTKDPMQPTLSDTFGGNDSFITKLNAAGNQLVFSTYFGGSSGGSGCGPCSVGNDIGRDIALDSNNNVYVVGYTDSPTFPTTNAIQEEIDGNTTQPVGSNYFDAYLAKIDASGQFRVYSTYLGGANDDVGLGVAVDADGNASVTGWTDSTLTPPLFPTTDGAFQEEPGGGGYTRDAFVTRVNSSGTALDYSTFLGGDQEDSAWGIALGSDGGAYVTGYTNSAGPQGYPTTENAYQPQNNGGFDAFLTRLSAEGSELIYSTYIGGNKNEGAGANAECLGCGDRYDGAAIAVDFFGNAFITGWTESTFVPPAVEGPPVSAVCGNGSVEFPPEQCDDGNDDSGDGCSDTCQVEFINFPTKEAAQPLPGSDAGATDEAARDAYVAKFNTNASGEDSLIYSTFVGGSRQDEGQGIALDSATNAIVVGWTATDESCDYQNLFAGKGLNVQVNEGNDFPTTSGAFQEEPLEGDDAFVTKIGGGGTTAAEDNFSIVGRVARPDGVSGVSGVTITLTRPDATTATDTTDENGYYAFDNLEPGEYSVSPSGGSSTDLYSPPSQDVTITNENERADFTATPTFSISGRVTTNGTTGLDGVTISVRRADNNSLVATAPTAVDGTYTVTGLVSDQYIVTPSRAFYTFAPTNREVTVDSNEVNVDFVATSAPGTVGFNTASLPGESSRNEDGKSFQITVTRIGDTSGAADVDYATFDGPPSGPPGPPAASERGDYITALGQLHFGANEASKTITIFIVDDALVEGSEALTLVLSNPSNNMTLSSPASVTLTILDNDINPSSPNPIDQTEFFVRQHYLDFLNREPDAGGFAFWVQNIESCGSDLQCRQTKRIDTSAAFFLSIEFQETGFVVVRAYRAAFDRQVEFREFLRDTQEIQRGIVVGQGAWQLQLEQHRQAFLRELVARPEFLTRYPESQTRDQYLDALFASADFTPTAAERLEVSNAYNSGASDQRISRANALSTLIQLERFRQRETSPAFVLMQYIGYLRRNPDDLGYNFWLNKLNLHQGDYGAAEMVAAFITSIEYRQRFGL